MFTSELTQNIYKSFILTYNTIILSNNNQFTGHSSLYCFIFYIIATSRCIIYVFFTLFWILVGIQAIC